MYSIEFDSGGGMIRVLASGFWSLVEATTFRDELAESIRDARRRCGFVRILIDASASSIQMQNVSEAFRPLQEAAIHSRNDCIAIVVGSTLVKLQARRILTSDQAGVFLTMPDAESWLLARPCPRAEGESNVHL